VAEPLIVAVVGAESTGKTVLARDLAAHLGPRATWVPETLRQWCEAQGRTPRQDEQAHIARQHTLRIDQAASTHDIVIADTTALMTAVYSRIVFGDDSLDAMAAAAHRACQLTLLTAIDLPWVSDGLQRDGPQVREPVDRLLRDLMQQHAIGFSLVQGQGPQRLQSALDALHDRLHGAPVHHAQP
jgi:nicotinamide riboside kinase